jgi:hypothetical protein
MEIDEVAFSTGLAKFPERGRKIGWVYSKF